MDLAGFGLRLKIQRMDAHRDFAMVRELDGIAHQIDQHLAQAQGVADQCCGYIKTNVKQQLQSFVLRLYDGQVGQILHHVFEVKFGRFEAHFSGLDFRKIQDVIDDAQQIARSGVHLFNVVALLGAQVGL